MHLQDVQASVRTRTEHAVKLEEIARTTVEQAEKEPSPQLRHGMLNRIEACRAPAFEAIMRGRMTICVYLEAINVPVRDQMQKHVAAAMDKLSVLSKSMQSIDQRAKVVKEQLQKEVGGSDFAFSLVKPAAPEEGWEKLDDTERRKLQFEKGVREFEELRALKVPFLPNT